MGFTMSIRLSVVALAMLAVAGCAPADYGQPGVQPGTVAHQGGYGSNGGYAYGGGSGYDGGYDDGPIFRPSRSLTCDRTRNICYDRFGLDYYETARYFGERDANHAVKKYGEQVFLFSPKRGVVCDRRTETCSNKRVANGNYGNSFNRTQARDGFGAIGSPSDWRYQQQQQQQQYWRYND